MARRGLTILELLVVICVIGLLIGLLLPAVLAAREAARRKECASHLRQLGVAVASYESQYGAFPAGSYGIHGSLHVALLPYVDQRPLYGRINWAGSSFYEVHAETSQVVVPLYLCPSESAPATPYRLTAPPHGVKDRPLASTNYAGNTGSGVQRYGYNGLHPHMENPYPHMYRGGPVRAADVRDGLSNTASMSEILHAEAGHSHERLRVIWQTPRRLDLPNQLDAFANLCQSIPPSPSDYGWRGNDSSLGTPWTWGDLGRTLYNHILTPNEPSCKNDTDWQRGAFTAASQHSGGVNVVFGDGHVKFVASEIERAVWREFGSRSENGGLVVLWP